MGKGSPKVEVTYYYMSIHYGISVPVDAILALTIKEKTAWTGDVDDLESFEISKRDLFGGDTKEGGLIGTVTFLPGRSDQVLPDHLAVRQGRANGEDCVGYRGISSIYFHREGAQTQGFYWGANNPFIPGTWVTVRRAPVGLDPDLALIPRGSSTGIEGQPLVLKWWGIRRIGSGTDTTRMRVQFLDSDNALMPGTEVVGATEYATDWTERTISTTVPAGATGVRLAIDMNPPSLINTGGWIDDITLTLNGEPITLINPGAETGDVTGWTNSSSFDLEIRSADPLPRTGSFYFGSPVQHDVYAYQDVQLAFEGIDANPAHIIYECLTNTAWGMGSPTTALDYDSFDTASQTLYAEAFGLSMLWTRQSTIQDFVQEVLDHIQGVLYVEPTNGLLTLTLIRGDYDAGTLNELTPDNADLSGFSRKLWGEIVNEISVTWTNPDNEQEETVTAHDIASIAMQSGVVSDSRNYYGVRKAWLAQQLAWRDLRSAGQPLASCDAEVDRTQWQLRPASVVKLTWPEYGLSEIVMRVMSIDYGRPGDPSIKLSLVEDVFGLDIGSYEDPPSSEWEDPTAEPQAMEFVDIFTMPLFFARQSTVAAFVDSPEYPEVVAGILASTSSSDTYEYQLWDEVALTTGDPEWQNIGTNNVIGRAQLADEMLAAVTTSAVEITGKIGNTSPVIGGFAIIGEAGEPGNEIALVTAVTGSTFDLKRGTLDTVPRTWPTGTPIWFVDESTLFEDRIVRASAEVVDYKLLSRTSLGLLTLAAAPLEDGTLTERPWLPNRPANVTVAGEAFTDQSDPLDVRARSDPWVTVTWAIRNRLDEDAVVLAWTDASATPETGQTTTIEVLDLSGDTLATHDGITGTTFDVPDSSFGAEPFVELRVYSERTDDDGEFVSLQYFSHWLWVDRETRLTEDGVTRQTESGAARLLEN